MEFCTKCNNTGSTTAEGYLDCTAPGCNAAADRVAFDKWLLREGYGQSGVKEWAIYRHAVRTAVESCSMLLDENERLRAALAQSQASYGALAMELAAAKVAQAGLVDASTAAATYLEGVARRAPNSAVWERCDGIASDIRKAISATKEQS